MRITRIEPQKRRQGRRNLYVDGVFVAGISDETLLRLGLRTGDEVDVSQLDALKKAEAADKAKRSALHFLSYRARTVREVRTNLRNKEIPEAEINAVLHDLESLGLLNDGEFARMYVRNQLAVRPSGRRLLKQKLLLLGISGSVADAALDEILQTSPPEEAALKAARKFVATRGARAKDTDSLRNRLAAFLGRRGFSWDIIRPVVRSIVNVREPEKEE